MSTPQETTATSSASPTPEDSTTGNSSSETQTPNPARTGSTAGDQDSPQPDEQQTPEQENEPQEETGDPKNKEAAKYRRRLRETEAERDALQTKLDATIDNVVNSKLHTVGVPARMLRKLDADLGSVFDQDGNFSDENLLDLVNTTLQEMGLEPGQNLKSINHTYQRMGRIDWTRNPAAGVVRSSGTGPEITPKSGWENVIKG